LVKQATLVENYVTRSMSTVPGYLLPLDAEIICALLSHQDEANIAGNLCEIGVHHGKLFLMLALARGAGERAVAVDLFEDDEINAGSRHAGRDRALFEHAKRLGVALSQQETFKTSSLEIGAPDILARTGGPIRFFSVDGGHLYRHVANDLVLAEKTLSENGVIAVDDFFNPGWMDVTFATYDFLRDRDNIVPFAVTSKKLYLAPVSVAETYKLALRSRVSDAQISSAPVLGREAIFLHRGMLKRGFEVFRSAIAEKL
jgi:hypothetical protein